jgi:signal transduction histidine kinase
MLKNYMVAGLILFALLSFFVYNYFITRQKLKLQTLRNKIASDLHDDVGSTLSSIAIFSEIAQQQSKEVIPLLQTISDNSRQMLDAMGDIVWTIHHENDQLEKIILRMRSYAYELLGAKQIGFDFTADDDIAHIKLPMDVRKNLFLIFKEATNNIVKYAEADMALFSIRSEGNTISMVIRDNGKGFDIDKPTSGNGLRNIQKRAKEVGGQVWIESLPGRGTRIQLNIAV